MEALEPIQIRSRMPLRSRLITLAIIAVYASVMACTNTRFTILDDESTHIVNSARPVLPVLQHFFTGAGSRVMHPPASEILLHLWLVATHDSFFALRIFANIFYIAGVCFTALSAEKIGGRDAYWVTLVLGFVWPFAFQYGRITGWYCPSFFLISLLTWAYLHLHEGEGCRPWIAFGIVSVLLVWTNYFGFAILFLLLADLLIFHRNLAVTHIRSLLAVMGIVVLAFLPALKIALPDLAGYAAPVAARMDWKNEIASAGYPAFAIFGSTAVAPWYLPLSVPIFVAVAGLFVFAWFSKGRKWLIYIVLTMVILQISGQMDVKRVLFLTPWLFLAMGLAAGDSTSRHPRLAFSALAVIVACGWLGIASGKHYATANLYEPWGKVAEVVAQDARKGATIVGGNPSFFLYLDYQLGLQSETGAAPGTYMGEDLYRSHGYKILEAYDLQTEPMSFRGKVVNVIGPISQDELLFQNALNERLRMRCNVLGEYRAAPDPAAALKARFSRYAPVLAYRTDVTWFNCP